MADEISYFVKGVPDFPGSLKVTFVDKPDDNAICQTCQSVTQNGHTDPKGHLFCRDCSAVLTDAAGTFTCPACNWQGVAEQMIQDTRAWEKVAGLRAYCPSADGTCQYKGKLSDMIKHYQKCVNPGGIECPFCKNRYDKKQLPGHMGRQCPSRIVQCCHCEVDMEAYLVQKHENSCDMRPATCEFCNKKMKTFAELRDQHRDRCTQRPRNCEFVELGCQFEGNEMQIAQHMARTNHMDVLVKRIGELTRETQELRRQLDVQSLAMKTMDELSRRLSATEQNIGRVTNEMAIQSANLQAQKQVQSTQKAVFERLFEETEKSSKSLREEVFQKLTEVPMEFTHVWKIQPYTHLRDVTLASSTKRLSSGKLYTGKPGYCIEFLVNLNARGGDSASSTHVGVHFKVHSGEYDELMPWPFHSRIVVTLKNHVHPGNSLQCEIVPRNSRPELQECFEKPQTGQANKIFGFSGLIATPLLENESKGFLLDNCVVLTFAIYLDADP